MAVTVKVNSKKLLADVPQEKVFWCHDGKPLKNMVELESAFKRMSEETFRYHLNQNKNDFSTWVRDVIGDEELASDLEDSSTRAQAARYVSDRIFQLKKQTK